MNMDDYRRIVIATSIMLILVASIPTLRLIVNVPNGSERFTELWLLGPQHRAQNYPFNISVDEAENVYVGVANHLGDSAYYTLYVKLANTTQQEATRESASNLAALYEFKVVLDKEKTWETLFTFQVNSASFSQQTCTITSLSMSNRDFIVSSTSAWNATRRGFYYRLFFELWIYNATQKAMQYHNRFVRLQLNMTG
jgi:uncharacterized membrane protein